MDKLDLIYYLLLLYSKDPGYHPLFFWGRGVCNDSRVSSSYYNIYLQCGTQLSGCHARFLILMAACRIIFTLNATFCLTEEILEDLMANRM